MTKIKSALQQHGNISMPCTFIMFDGYFKLIISP